VSHLDPARPQSGFKLRAEGGDPTSAHLSTLQVKFLFFVQEFLNRQAREERKGNLLKIFARFAVFAVNLFGSGLSGLGTMQIRGMRILYLAH